MRILCISPMHTAFDLDGSPCFALNASLAESEGVEVSHVLVAEKGAFEGLLHRKCVFPVAGYYLPNNAKVNVRILSRPRVQSEVGRLEHGLRLILREWPPDIAHLWDVQQNLWMAILRVLKQSGVPIAITFDQPGRSIPVQTIAESANALLVSSGRMAKAIERHSDFVGPTLDCRFWTPGLVGASERDGPEDVLVTEGETRAYVVCALPSHRSQNPGEWQFLPRLIRRIARRAEKGRCAAVQFVMVLRNPYAHGIGRQQIEQSIDEYGIRSVVKLVGTQPSQLRALFANSQVVLLTEAVGSRWFSLEAMRMGSVVLAPRDSAAAEYVQDGSTGFLYDPLSVIDASDKLEHIVSAKDARSRIAAAARNGVEQFSATRNAGTYLKLFMETQGGAQKLTHKTQADQFALPEIVSPGPSAIVHDIAAQEPEGTDWIRNTVLAIDLDLTLIRLSPIFDVRPTPFPISAASELDLSSDLGRRYGVRGCLEALERILHLPWRAKLVWSTSSQAKVDQSVRQIRIGSQSLMEWTNAWVGSELLNHFADARGICLTLRKEKQLTNPDGQTVKSKPSQFLQLQDFQSLGLALLKGDWHSALRFVENSNLEPGLGLVLDDQGFLEPANPSFICYRVLPYREIEDFEEVFVPTETNSALLFNFLDHLWHVMSSPFHFLAYLLDQRPGWDEFRRRLNTEYEISDALRHADSIRQFRWMRVGAIPSRWYRDYLASHRSGKRELLSARFRQHATLYRTLAEDYVAEDVRRGWSVLLLGRDMDYAFQCVRSLYPDLVRECKVALLPLSRSALANADDQCLMDLLSQYLPGWQSSDAKGIRVYDVGFHGTIPARLARVVQRLGKGTHGLEARLLSRCLCSSQKQTCSGEEIKFVDGRGEFAVSRSFGISIERCPHRTGPLDKISRGPEGFAFQFSAQKASESRRAERLANLLEVLTREGKDRLPNRADAVRLIAYQALPVFLRDTPRKVHILKKSVVALHELSKVRESQAVKFVVYPLCGTDLLSPLLCFPNLERLFLVNEIPACAYREERDSASAAAYLADLMALFGRDFVQPLAALERVHSGWAERLTNVDHLYAQALLSSGAFLALIRLLPAMECHAEPAPSSGLPHLAWTLQQAGRPPIEVEYFCCRAGMAQGEVCEKLQQALAQSTSALVLKGVTGSLMAAVDPPLRNWVNHASVILHDDSLVNRKYCGEDVPLLDGFNQRASSATGVAHRTVWNTLRLSVRS